MAGSSHSKQLWHSMAMCSRPLAPSAMPAKSEEAACTSGSTSSASRSSRSPAAVNRAGRVLRKKSGQPRRSSMSLS